MTQLCGAGAVLVGTIAFALLLDQLDAIYIVILSAWASAGMAALICGGWAARPSPTNLVIGGSFDAAFCGVLLAVASRLPMWLRSMPPGDVELATTLVISLAITSAVTCVLCLVATPMALRYWRTVARGPEPEPLTPANTAPGFPPPVTTGAFLAATDDIELGTLQVPQRHAPPALAFGPAVARSSIAFAAPAQPTMAPSGPAMGSAMASSGAMPQPWALPVQAPAGQPAAPSWPAQPAPGYAPTPSAYASRTPTGSPLPLPPGFDGTPPPYHAPAFTQPPNHAPAFAQPGYAPPPNHAPAFAQPGYAPNHEPAFAQPLGYAPQPVGTPPGFSITPAAPHAQPVAPTRPAAHRGALTVAIGLTVGCAGALVLALVLSDGGSAKAPTAAPPTASPTAPRTTAEPTVAPTSPAVPAARVDSFPTVEALLEELHRVVASADEKAMQRLLWPKAFAFAVRATGRQHDAEAVASAWARDLGAAPTGGFSVEPQGTAIGQEGEAAWIAEELLVRGGGQDRTFTVSMLAASIGGSWKIVAWHWAVRLPDDEIERRLEQGEQPIPESFDDRLEAPEAAVEAFREAFASPAAFALTVSSRPTALNFGSAPRERLIGGDSIRRVFRKLPAELALGEGVMVVASSAWDETQRAAPQVAWAAANVEFVTKRSRRLLRVLAVLVQEGGEWRIVQTQWSDGL